MATVISMAVDGGNFFFLIYIYDMMYSSWSTHCVVATFDTTAVDVAFVFHPASLIVM